VLKITALITPNWLKAIERAATNHQAGRVALQVAPGIYEVPSSTGDGAYTVRIINLGSLLASCTCPHGSKESSKGHCWHTVSALCREVERVSKPGRVLDATMRRLVPTGQAA